MKPHGWECLLHDYLNDLKSFKSKKFNLKDYTEGAAGMLGASLMQSHLVWMLMEMLENEFDSPAFNRELGFIQGTLWALGKKTLEQIKQDITEATFDSHSYTEEVVEKMKEIKVKVSSDQDEVNHPSHYVAGRKYEPIDVIEDWDLGFHLGNVLKYVSRAGRKEDELKDLKKAQWYLEKRIAQVERNSK